MSFFIAGAVIIFLSSVSSLFFGRKGDWASRVGGLGTVIGSAIALIPPLQVLLKGGVLSLQTEWSIPFGTFFIQIDSLSAFFLLPILVLCALAAVYGIDYLKAYQTHRNLGPVWFFFNLLLVSMLVVVTARNSLLFLIAWELMTLASFFLVTFEHHRPAVRQAGFLYLLAAHIGTAFLIIFFVLLGSRTGSADFAAVPKIPSMAADILFVLAVIGFGIKAGFMPLHIWLPHAHPAAPSHVSAVMSGVMIKTGIYGLVRTICLLQTPPAWWGWTLIILGAVSGLLGALFASAQQDLKRLLAYCSVENIGIIALGLGTGLLGIHQNHAALAVLGIAGGLLHVLNHAFFKGLLFLSAGSVLHSTGTGQIDRLGGLMKQMPWTAAAFLIGAVAVPGIPPLNGFFSEFLIYLGLFKKGINSGLETVIAVLLTVGGLALIGGLALAAFTKAFGIVFLGSPRSASAQHAHEAGPLMKTSFLILAMLCLLLGLFSPRLIYVLRPVLLSLTGLTNEAIQIELVQASSILSQIVKVAVLFGLLAGGLFLVRIRLLRGRRVESAVTWDCGYAQPDSRMQYTGTSFTQFLADLFGRLLPTRKNIASPTGFFPNSGQYSEETDDSCEKYLFRPAARQIVRLSAKLQWLQHGRLQVYILYIALALWILLIWKLM
ncbi:MAG TPA: proton-conducting transporter membrane subunit [Anaerohalosphaeraceae bacterium]|nr:proton-conducting transporter membrane subunit [Anaerohalosphaeraceae bacterium]HOL87624.1 proton-conducting transporter membrane subunit [Anaerohalosphaeraceae bacterium]HPP55869.1 proton-conducting transporter membrane subunit [Anaerohalosphaeraceae bacterium]